MILQELEYNIGDNVTYKEEGYIIIGRSQFEENGNWYLIQEELDYWNNGFNFFKSKWVTEGTVHEIDLPMTRN